MKVPCISPCGHACELRYKHHQHWADWNHQDCTACIHQWLSRNASCPNDRNPLTSASLLALPADDQTTFPSLDEEAPMVPSAKIDELVKYLMVFDRRDKTLVFSQFTSFLDRVATRLRGEEIRYCRFDGSMSAKKVSLCFENSSE
jgi:SWI/SNF-related matrix-associated actin-dependent regulator of chromatin subfamily A3